MCRWRKFYLNFDRKIIDPKTVVVASLCLVILPGRVGFSPPLQFDTVWKHFRGDNVYWGPLTMYWDIQHCGSLSLIINLTCCYNDIYAAGKITVPIVLLQTGERNERAATILTVCKSREVRGLFIIFSFWHGGHLGSSVGQIKCLVINCKAIFKVEKKNTFTVNASIQWDLEKINLYLKGLDYNLAKLSSHD